MPYTPPSNQTTAEVQKTVRALHLVMPSKAEIAHNRSNTDSSVLLGLHNDLSAETPLTGPDGDYSDDNDQPERSWRKLPILRKKSGELIRPALRPSSARRWPSSMPSTPTFSKAVHFDSHLEHVRHFLQVDKPLAVSAGSSPVEAYDSDTELPFGKEDESNGGSPPYKWELVVSSFPAETPERLLLPVRVERVFLSPNNKILIGSVAVANLAYNKIVIARFTLDYWKTTSEVVAEYNDDVCQQKNGDGYDRFNFHIKLTDQANLEAKSMFFCVKYVVNGQEYWDSNNSANIQIDFRKKYNPQNGKKGIQGIGLGPVHYSLPQNHKFLSPTSAKPRTGLPAFGDYADGLDAEYKFVNSKESIKDFLAEPDCSVRLKGSQSAIHLGSDNLTRRVYPNRKAFSNRYSFTASLSAAIQAKNTVLSDCSGICMKSSTKKQNKIIADAPVTESPISSSPVNANTAAFAANSVPMGAVASSANSTDSPRPAATEKPVLASQSFNELLDKYCFLGSSKTSLQIRQGRLRSGQFDGNIDDGYILGSVDSSVNSSPLMLQS